ncbi:MAG TPA: hypothetical protein VNF04_16470 [Stellaceae bacterium]|nr:hypothetical protein [Stellaceae bacterium]
MANVPRGQDARPIVRQARRISAQDLLTAALARPLFSPTRRPPVAEGPVDFDLSDKRLAGIVIEAGRRLAIFAVTGAKPLTLSEGEIVNGWEIENITPQEVSLRGPAGTRTLQPKPDGRLIRRAPSPPFVNPGRRLPRQLTAAPPLPAGRAGVNPTVRGRRSARMGHDQ